MVDYSNDTFGAVEQIANGKMLSLVCNYHYELKNSDGKIVFWSYFLSDIANFLRNYNA